MRLRLANLKNSDKIPPILFYLSVVVIKFLITILTSSIFLSGCSTFGAINNSKKTTEPTLPGYSIQSVMSSKSQGKVTLLLSFSGGGSRAAALAYGVLQELRDTHIQHNGHTYRLLDEVDVISSVSGGSFTAAYYGLHGDKTFKEFEKVFLRRDISTILIQDLFNPTLWFSAKGRTDRAIEFYETSVFKDATFADLQKQNGPLIVINASDLGNGIRFSFTQEYFDLLCSNINDFPIASAVAASSAVPLVFDPVIIENYQPCQNEQNGMLMDSKQTLHSNQVVKEIQEDLQQYRQTDKNSKYIHLVDGGITDNLGLRAIYDVVELSGGVQQILKKFKQKPVGYFAVIAVNASTLTSQGIGQTNQVPSIEDTINAVSDIQLHRYNTATIEIFKKGMQRWSQELSTPEKKVKDYFIEVGFDDIKEPPQRNFFNAITSSFTLTKDEVDKLIEAGRTLLRNHPAYKALVDDLNRPVDKSESIEPNTHDLKSLIKGWFGF